MRRSAAIGWENNPSGRFYGLPFFPGKKVGVSLGQLDRSFWYEHSSQRIRIMFTFNKPLGLLATTYGSVIRESSWYPEAHQFCIIPPGLETTLDWLRKGPLVVLFVDSSLFAGDALFPFGVIVRDLNPLSRSDPCLVQLARVFWTLCRQAKPPEPNVVEGAGIALASQALAQCFSPCEPGRKPRSGLPDALVDKVTRYVDAHLAEPIPAKELAAQVGLSPDHFARRFRIATEMSPKQFVLRRRVEKVDDLLRSGEYNVTEAARMAGFHDLSHLNRCFRKFFGHSPKDSIGNALASDSYR